MKRADAYTIDTIGVPSVVLMERAALAVMNVLQSGRFSLKRVLVVCGTGNNGGDGMAVARLLFLAGVDVTVSIIGDMERGSEQAKAQYRILHHYRVPETDNIENPEYTTIVDALFGVGLSREVTGAYAECLDAINRHSAKVLAVDVPSGIHSDTGGICRTAVRADETVTFAFEKAGILLYPGAEYAGKVTIADIGITKEGFAGCYPKMTAFEAADLEGIAPRQPRSNKGTYGKVLIIAGSRGVAGAAFLSACAAYRTGCGLVKIYTEAGNRSILQTLLPEAMVVTYEKNHIDTEELKTNLAWADAVVFGPGVGTGAMEKKLLGMVLAHCKAPLVLDADGITMLACRPELWKEHPDTCVLTPHPGEMARLLGRDIREITEDISGCAREAAKKLGAVCVLKDARTVTADRDGQMVVNLTGNHGMATGGSGDVLTGIVAALLAQGTDAVKAAAAGVWLHGSAGDRAAKALGAGPMLARDILQHIKGPEDELRCRER